MLSLQDIAERIQNPELIGANDLEALNELSSKYPYTQIFSILYLKGLANTGNVHFEEELLKHSYRIGDRTQLYHLIKEAASIEVETTKIEEKEIIAETAEVNIPVDATVEEKAIPEEKADEPIDEIIPVETKVQEIVIPEVKVEIIKEIVEAEIVADPAEIVAEEIIPIEESVEKETVEELVEEPVEIEDEKEEVIPVEEEIIVEAVETPTEEIILEVETQIDELPVEINEEVQEFSEIEEITIESTETTAIESENETQETPEQKYKLDETILHYALTANYELGELTEDEGKLLEKKENKEEKTTPKVEQFPVDTKQSFTSWLHSNKNYKVETDYDKLAIEAVVNDFSDFNPMDELFGESTKPKKEFFSAAKKSKGKSYRGLPSG